MAYLARLSAALLLVATAATVASPADAGPITPDPGFGGDGSVTLHSATHAESPGDLRVLDDGKVMVVTYTNADPGIEVWRLREDGTSDPTYGGGDGVVAFGGSDNYEDLHLTVDPLTGKSYVSAFVDGSPFPTFIWRLTASGSPDPTFGSGTGQVSFVQRIVHDLTTAPGGKLVMVGGDFVAGTSNVWQLTNTGAPDAGFGTAGTRVLSVDTNDGADGLLRQEDGKLVIAGSHYNATTSTMPVYRVTAAGALDPSFGGDGKTVVEPSSPGTTTSTVWAPDIVVRPDGRLVVVAGLNQNNGGFITTLLVAGLKASGAPDTQFGTHVYSELFTTDASAALQRNGVLVVGGTRPPTPSTTGGIVRINPDGAYDLSWSGDGLLPVPGTQSSVQVGLLPTGRLIAAFRPDAAADTQLLALKGTKTPTCQGKLATQFGGHAADTIKGTPKKDVLVGGGGKDKIKGRGGNDRICGGGKADQLFGGPGKDKIYGQGGNDLLVGNSGVDQLYGGAGTNSINP
jgi:uncharacterized delta-60 repeat protein